MQLGGCADGSPASPVALECPAAQGEFPPSGCAIVTGVALRMNAEPLVNIFVRVFDDNASTEVYAPEPVRTGPTGEFQLVVYRIQSLSEQPRESETSSVSINAYTSTPIEWAQPSARAVANLHFAPLGAAVPASTAELRFALP
jgi:hypothetical protein